MSNIPLSERRLWVGASESAAILGLSPHKTKFELWHEKAGNIPPVDLSGNSRVSAGKFFEPSIAAWASDNWHWPLMNVADYRSSPTVARMGASLDFETLSLEPVEIKNVDASVFFKDEEWIAEGDQLIEAPLHFMIQVQHQLACPKDPASPPEQGHLVVCVGGNRLYRMTMARHPGLIAKLEGEVDAFWRSIENNEPPEPNFEADAGTIGMLYGGSGEDCADLRGNERALALCEAYRNAHEIAREADKRKKAALAELKVLMRDARSAVMDEGFKIKASHLKETTSVRKAHWRFNINQSTKEKSR